MQVTAQTIEGVNIRHTGKLAHLQHIASEQARGGGGVSAIIHARRRAEGGRVVLLLAIVGGQY